MRIGERGHEVGIVPQEIPEPDSRSRSLCLENHALVHVLFHGHRGVDILRVAYGLQHPETHPPAVGGVRLGRTHKCVTDGADDPFNHVQASGDKDNSVGNPADGLRLVQRRVEDGYMASRHEDRQIDHSADEYLDRPVQRNNPHPRHSGEKPDKRAANNPKDGEDRQKSLEINIAENKRDHVERLHHQVEAAVGVKIHIQRPGRLHPEHNQDRCQTECFLQHIGSYSSIALPSAISVFLGCCGGIVAKLFPDHVVNQILLLLLIF